VGAKAEAYPPNPMRFTAEEYFRAANERMRQAEKIHHSREGYALAMYCSGLAVECMLRAFRWQEDASFEGRHNLADLFKASHLLRIHGDRARAKGISEEDVQRTAAELRAAVTEVQILWRNNLRFASEASLRAHLNRIDRFKGIRGDALKKNSLDLLNWAKIIVNRGVTLWTSKTR
jgi:hypothetical protein